MSILVKSIGVIIVNTSEKIVNTFESKEPMNPHAVNPEYLKLTEAEESKLN